MKSYIAAAALFAAIASAQSITDLPSCSLGCVANSVLSLCSSVTDFECACGAADKLTASATPCVQAACTDAADQAKVITVLEGICAGAGFPITLEVPSSTPAATPTPEASSTPAATSAEATATSEAEVSSVVSAASSAVDASSSIVIVSTPYTTVAASPSSYPTSYVSSNGTVTTAAPTQFTGAASANGVTFGAAGVLGLLAYVL